MQLDNWINLPAKSISLNESSKEGTSPRAGGLWTCNKPETPALARRGSPLAGGVSHGRGDAEERVVGGGACLKAL